MEQSQESVVEDDNMTKSLESEIKPMETSQPARIAFSDSVIPTSGSSSVQPSQSGQSLTPAEKISQEATMENVDMQSLEETKEISVGDTDTPMDTITSVSAAATSLTTPVLQQTSGTESGQSKEPVVSQTTAVQNFEKPTASLSLAVSSAAAREILPLVPITTSTVPAVQTQPKSIFSSLFSAPVATVAKSMNFPKSEKPASPSMPSPATQPPISETQKELELKNLKAEALKEAETPFPITKGMKKASPAPTNVDVPEASMVTGSVSKAASPLPMVREASPVSVPTAHQIFEKMDTDVIPLAETSKIANAPNSSAGSQNLGTTDPVVVNTKIEVKHPPIAAKTMKREPRKTSTTSPTESKKTQRSKSTSSSPGGKTKKKRPPPKEQDNRNDFYCWICHKEGEVLCCELCPRVFHAKCLNMNVEPEGDWFCPECEKITDAECKETQSRAMSMLTIDQFSLLLKYVIQRMKVPMSEPFHEPVDTKIFKDYYDYVFHPMDLSTIEKNVKKRKYGCPEAFLIEFKWVIHNCIIYNSQQSKLTQTAKSMLKIAERELNEIEVCPECYLNSCRKRENWFCEPCMEIHPLVWAKLQGFPHWPAKALRIDKGLVDVRFFGQHDRAWIPLSGCYLISKELPLPIKNKKKSKGPGLRGGLDGAMQEMQVYIENIKKITGDFEYAPPRTLLTHCDLHRKTVSTGHSGKQQTEIEGKAASTSSSKADSTSEIKGLFNLKLGKLLQIMQMR